MRYRTKIGVPLVDSPLADKEFSPPLYTRVDIGLFDEANLKNRMGMHEKDANHGY